ncbi:MAG TPA: N-acetylmuramoyl-L-alanine amidase, partial [Methylomirabilota bacterium]|nr:N-acetylmuramoyl-L-alanine amidase [Methylomirabilota bacterium]
GSSVVNVRYGVYPDKTRVVLDLDAAAAYQGELQTQPDRIAIDLKDCAAELDSAAASAGRGLVKSIHAETEGPGASRLVLDLSAPAHLIGAQFLPAADGAPPRIFVDLQPGFAEPKPAAAEAAAPVPQPATADTAPVPSKPSPDAADADAAPAAAAEPPPPFPPAKPPLPGPEADTGSVSLAAMAIPATLAPPKPADQGGHRIPVIVLDPGHGGKDPGANGPDGTLEKNVTLQMAKDLKRVLESTGRYRVVLTREDDTFLALRARIDVARAAGADLFISLHADHNDDASLRGASVYTLSDTASDVEAAAVAARENKDGLITGVDLTNQSPMVTSILVDLAQRETRNLSDRFAGMLTDTLAEGTATLPESHRFAGFVVLKALDVPSALVELGYLSNEDDESALVSSRHRERMAKAMREAIDRFFTWQRSVRSS